jgi:mRNA-degrading endonuclease HigB of HigAB toxin-antitoxin module
MNIEHFSFNKIIVIQSLTIDHTGLDLYNDTIKIRQFQFPDEFTAEYYDISSGDEFKNLLANISSAVEHGGVVPVIHFDIHGSKTGLVLKNGDFVGWKLIVDHFRNINKKTNNNLLVTFATCFSSFILNYIDLREKCPFWSYVSTNTEIVNEDISLSFNAFYDSLLMDRNIETAANALTANNLNKGLILSFKNTETLFNTLVNEVEVNRFNNPTALKEMENEAVRMFLEKSPDQSPEMARMIVQFWYRQRNVFYQAIHDGFLYKKN